ncbi:MAG: DUF1427 family protein [Elusimicrobia bacterium]|nr:DUF1427 family protein [Elusimicrobiota bacterium]MDE2313555.1 DUF1427 family protein [Elusimicrobiota bacterium]
MRIAVGLVLSFIIGFSCRWFELPAPSPPEIFGVLLVVAMTLGYVAAGSFIHKKPAPQAPPQAVSAAQAPSAK